MIYDTCKLHILIPYLVCVDLSIIIVQLNSQYITITIHCCLCFTLYYIVPVRFSQTTYYVTEGKNSYTVITLEALAIHNMSFSVIVTTRDGSAVGEIHAIHRLWTNLFHYQCT